MGSIGTSALKIAPKMIPFMIEEAANQDFTFNIQTNKAEQLERDRNNSLQNRR